jgi:predicted amidophosphoribosyltransferase
MVTTTLGAASDLLLGQTCAGCGAPGPTLLCPRCRCLLEPAPFAVHPLTAPPGFPPTVAACRYEGPVRRLLVAHKESGRLRAAVPLGRLLAEAVATAVPGPQPVLLVPVPSRSAVVRSRGHDPVARMARVAARRLASTRRVRVAALLRHGRRVVDQSGLDHAQRCANLQGALVLRSRPLASPPGHVVVVDDICSSGSTLTAAAEALAGWAGQIRAAVVAAPPAARDRWR